MTDQSPYQAPSAILEVAQSSDAIGPPVKRPLSVWLTLIILIIVYSLMAVGFLYGIYVSRAIMVENFHQNPARFAIGMLIRLAVFAPLFGLGFGAIRGIIRRTKFGRWGGVAFLVLVFVAGVIGNLTEHQESAHNLLKYSNGAERLGEEFGSFTLSIGYLVLLYRFGFSTNSKAYFSSKPPATGGSSKWTNSEW